MRDLKDLNINDEGEPVKRSPPSDDEIAIIESQLGSKLPLAYLTLLRYSNGGHPELDSIVASDDGANNEWSVNRFFHIDSDKEDMENVFNVLTVWRPVLGNAALPFESDGGGNVFFMDTTSPLGPVRICIHDEGFLVHGIAPSFEDFVDRLSVNPDFI